MKIAMLPLYIRGVADLETDSIILSWKQSAKTVWDTVIHELAHLLVRDKRHSSAWLRCYEALGGSRTDHRELFDQMFLNIGYMPNIGNISGIQNIY